MLKGPMAELPLDDNDNLNLLFSPTQGFDKLAIAVSGGNDSMALMLLAAKWRSQQEKQPEITILTVDHGLRVAAKEETAFVANNAIALGLDVEVLEGSIANPETSIQAKARELRYQLMGEAMQRRGIDCLLTAHHQDDQAETVLMRLSRGTSVTGLGGMSKLRVQSGICLVRPLLDVSRQRLEDFVKSTGFEVVNDPSNENSDFERVRWRKTMPVLAELGLKSDKISLSARRLRRADSALASISENLYEEQFVIDPFGCSFFDLEELLSQPPEIGIRLLARAIDDAGGETSAPLLSRVEALYDHLGAGITNFKGLTLGGCFIVVKDGTCIVGREAGRLEIDQIFVQPGKSIRWDNRFQIVVAEDFTSPICVSTGQSISRQLLEDLQPGIPFVPMDAVHSAPVLSADDRILAIGEHVMFDGIDVFRIFGPNALI